MKTTQTTYNGHWPFLNLEFSEQRAPRMLASIWPSRDENHGQDGHNLELGTIVNRFNS